MRHLIVTALALGTLLACAGARPASAPSAHAQASTAHAALPFIEDDYARALAEARTKNLPLFVDTWAPW